MEKPSSSRGLARLLRAFLLAPCGALAAEAGTPSVSDDNAILPKWHGVWRGQLEDAPAPLAPAPVVEFVVDEGEDAFDGCLTWRFTYAFDGAVAAVKDYLLCRDTDNRYRLDEGEGLFLHMSAYGDELYSAFALSQDDVALFTHTRLDGDAIVHDIYSTKGRDEPKPGVVTFKGAKRQRVILKRAGPP